MAKAYLLLGSNLGDRLRNVARARDRIAGIVTISATSPVYETEPWGLHSQPMFLNQALEITTTLTPFELRDQLSTIERQLGKADKPHPYGPRYMDIDILLYDQHVMNDPELQLPHPRLHLRRFALAPLNSIAPELVHPVLNKTISELLEECSDELHVEELSPHAS